LRLDLSVNTLTKPRRHAGKVTVVSSPSGSLTTLSSTGTPSQEHQSMIAGSDCSSAPKNMMTKTVTV
jgi:hypothetical protein